MILASPDLRGIYYYNIVYPVLAILTVIIIAVLLIIIMNQLVILTSCKLREQVKAYRRQNKVISTTPRHKFILIAFIGIPTLLIAALIAAATGIPLPILPYYLWHDILSIVLIAGIVTIIRLKKKIKLAQHNLAQHDSEHKRKGVEDKLEQQIKVIKLTKQVKIIDLKQSDEGTQDSKETTKQANNYET